MTSLIGLPLILSSTTLTVQLLSKSRTFHCLLDLRVCRGKSVHRNTCERRAFPLSYGRYLKTVCPLGFSDPLQTKKSCRKWTLKIGSVLNPTGASCSVDSQELGHTGVGSMVTLPAKGMPELTLMRCVISLPASAPHQIVHNGSTRACTGRTALKVQPRDIGMLTPSLKKTCAL